MDFEGLDIWRNDAQCVNMSGVETSYDVYDRANHIQFKRCRMEVLDTDGQSGGENFKSAQADYILMEDCELFTSGCPTSDTVDWLWNDYSVGRRLYIHDYNNAAVYTKGGSNYDIFEQCVIVQSHYTQAYTTALCTGDGSGLEFSDPTTAYETLNLIFRNNLDHPDGQCRRHGQERQWALSLQQLVHQRRKRADPVPMLPAVHRRTRH